MCFKKKKVSFQHWKFKNKIRRISKVLDTKRKKITRVATNLRQGKEFHAM